MKDKCTTFCAECGDCLDCYGGDPCAGGGGHVAIVLPPQEET